MSSENSASVQLIAQSALAQPGITIRELHVILDHHMGIGLIGARTAARRGVVGGKLWMVTDAQRVGHYFASEQEAARWSDPFLATKAPLASAQPTTPSFSAGAEVVWPRNPDGSPAWKHTMAAAREGGPRRYPAGPGEARRGGLGGER